MFWKYRIIFLVVYIWFIISVWGSPWPSLTFVWGQWPGCTQWYWSVRWHNQSQSPVSGPAGNCRNPRRTKLQETRSHNTELSLFVPSPMHSAEIYNQIQSIKYFTCKIHCLICFYIRMYIIFCNVHNFGSSQLSLIFALKKIIILNSWGINVKSMHMFQHPPNKHPMK